MVSDSCYRKLAKGLSSTVSVANHRFAVDIVEEIEKEIEKEIEIYGLALGARILKPGEAVLITNLPYVKNIHE